MGTRTLERSRQRRASVEIVEDRTLVELASQGDGAEAFAGLVRRHSGLVCRVASRMLDREEAQDACQEVWVRAWRGMDGFRRDSCFTTWLYRITVNTCLSARRKVARRRSREAGEPLDFFPSLPDGGYDPEAATLNRERRKEIQASLRHVRAEHRAALVLRHMDGMSYAEVATTLNVPQGTAKGWVHRGRIALLAAMNQESTTTPNEPAQPPRRPPPSNVAEVPTSRPLLTALAFV